MIWSSGKTNKVRGREIASERESKRSRAGARERERQTQTDRMAGIRAHCTHKFTHGLIILKRQFLMSILSFLSNL